mmetsp:Transcript_59797/g.134841  ORF Transcript_59797/g.134841 Transcript_59797/m.134841 type:complete len:217 (+) Transcript_59797:1359-2009(+)
MVSICSSCRVFGTSFPLRTSAGSKLIAWRPRPRAAESAMCCRRSIFASRSSGHSSETEFGKPVAWERRRATSCTNFGGGRASSSCGVLFLFSPSSCMSWLRTHSLPSTVSSVSSADHSWIGRSLRGGSAAAPSPAPPPSAPPTLLVGGEGPAVKELSMVASAAAGSAPGTRAAPRRTSSETKPTSSAPRELKSSALASACCSMSCRILPMSSTGCA